MSGRDVSKPRDRLAAALGPLEEQAARTDGGERDRERRAGAASRAVQAMAASACDNRRHLFFMGSSSMRKPARDTSRMDASAYGVEASPACRDTGPCHHSNQAHGDAHMPPDILTVIDDLLLNRADGAYGLHRVTQRQHALQSAWLAERDGQPDAVVTAALLHDIGHLVHDLGDNPAAEGVDDRHEELGHAWLTRHFGPEVTEPVRLHVAAKRYLCATEADYFGRLSPDSVRSLALQGGPMDEAEVAAFKALPHHAAAVTLRRYDEAAKVPDLETPPVAHFMPAVARCLGAVS